MPAALVDLDPVVFGGCENIAPGQIPVRVGDILDLIKARHGIADVARVGERFLPLPGKGEHARGQPVLVLRAQLPVLGIWLPGCLGLRHQSSSRCLLARSHGHDRRCALRAGY